MSTDALVTFVILGATVVLFASDLLRLDVVALLCLLALVLTGVAPLEIALSGFSSPAVLMIAGLFVIGAALTETGVADWLGRRLESVVGTGEARVTAVMMSATALVSAFMSSTGTVAIFLPIIGTLAMRKSISPSRLFMPLAFATHLGSNLTLISTPPNLLVSDALREAGREPFRFFSFLVPGLVVFLVGIAYFVFFGRKLLPAGDKLELAPRSLSQSELASEYGLGAAVCSVRVGARSKLVGMTLATADLRAAHGITVVAVRRRGEPIRVVPRVTFEAGDELGILGSAEAVEALVTRLSLDLVTGPSELTLPLDESLSEVVIPRRSRLVGQTLRAVKFRDRYRANVFAVRRAEAGRPVSTSSPTSLRDLVIRAGDTLLVKGRRKYLHNFHDDRTNVVLVAEPDAIPGVFVDRPRALGAMAITLMMLVIMAFGWLPNVVAVLLAAVLLVVTGCVRPADVYRAVNWESVVLIAGMLPLAVSLERTGGTAIVVGAVEGALRGASPSVILALLVAITSAFGMVLSNTATAVLVAPIAVRLASAFGIAPEPLLMGVAFAASAAFATPIASPVNVLVMTPGNYRFTDYVKVGLPLQVLVLTTAVLVIPLVWPF